MISYNNRKYKKSQMHLFLGYTIRSSLNNFRYLVFNLMEYWIDSQRIVLLVFLLNLLSLARYQPAFITTHCVKNKLYYSNRVLK